jgi:hypothetical protein
MCSTSARDEGLSRERVHAFRQGVNAALERRAHAAQHGWHTAQSVRTMPSDPDRATGEGKVAGDPNDGTGDLLSRAR